MKQTVAERKERGDEKNRRGGRSREVKRSALLVSVMSGGCAFRLAAFGCTNLRPLQKLDYNYIYIYIYIYNYNSSS